MSHIKLHLAFSLIIPLSATSSADEIILVNGDILQGTQTEITDTHIIWNTDNFGALSIAIDQVLTVSGVPLSNTPAEVDQALSEEMALADIKGFFGESFVGSTAVFGNISSGNDERNEWGIDTEISWLNDDLRHRSILSYESKSADDSEAAVKYLLSHSVDWFFKDTWFWSNKGSIGANDNRSIDSAYTIGSNVGNQFWDTDQGSLLAETGLVWISETFLDGSKDDRMTVSWSSDYSKLLFEQVRLSHSHQLLVAIEDTDNSQFLADIGFDFPLIDNLFTKISLEWAYDNQPVVGVEKIDRKLNLGVNYSW
mgnify:FL=1